MQKTNIYFVSTPIGCLDDLSPRALAALKKADTIYSEHPQTTKKIFQYFSLPPKKWILFDQKNEKKKIDQLLIDSQRNCVAIVSRAGMPAINDPGTYLMRQLLEKNIPFEFVPGPSISSCLMALSGSFGPFHYFGYFPKKHKEATDQLFITAQSGGTGLYLESKYRIKKTFRFLLSHLENQENAKLTIVHELTKMHQKIYHGTLSELAAEPTFQEALDLTKGEWSFSISLPANLEFGDWRKVEVKDLKTLCSHKFHEKVDKFAKKYKFSL